jgi:hypothetical protein
MKVLCRINKCFINEVDYSIASFIYTALSHTRFKIILLGHAK